MTAKKSFVKDYMTKNVISVSPDTPTEDIITLMKNLDELDDDTKMWLKHFIKYNVTFHFDHLKDDIEIK